MAPTPRRLADQVAPAQLCRSFCLSLFWLFALNCYYSGVAAAEPDVKVESVFLQPSEEANAPARESGLLTALDAVAGKTAREGEALAHVDDTAARLALSRAKLELGRARQRAANDLAIRLAEKKLEVEQSELRRARNSLEKYPRSVSLTEIDQLRLAVEQAELEGEQARVEFAELQVLVAVQENEVQVAEHALERRRVLSPFTGVVVERLKLKGEWVQAGDAVVRLIRIDRLRAEGLVDATIVNRDWIGRSVQVTAREGERTIVGRGKLVFVSPEVEPASHRVRIWAEVDNQQLLLRPGIEAEMTIER